MATVISIQTGEEFDVNTLPYKFAIPEHEPIKLSNGKYLRSYRVTKYNDHEPAGDADVEHDAFEREMYG